METIISREEFIKINIGNGLIKKQKGRWGTVHYYISKKGDYQNIDNKTFDGYKQFFVSSQ